MKQIIKQLTTQFNSELRITERRPSIYQVSLPFYHDDGDMFQIYLQKKNNKWKISDFGDMFMRLSYSCKKETKKTKEIIQRKLKANGLCEDNGDIFLYTDNDKLLSSIFQFAIGISTISYMYY